jgi:hypothetical protein
MISEDPLQKDYYRKREIVTVLMSEDEDLLLRADRMCNGSIPAEVLEMLHNKITMPRVLDGEPPILKLNSKGGVQSGTYELFNQMYNAVRVDTSVDQGKIDIAGTIIYCDVLVIKTIKTLIKMGCSRNEDLIVACRNLIMDIVKRSRSGEVITVNRMLERLEGKKYYEKKIVEAIKALHE